MTKGSLGALTVSYFESLSIIFWSENFNFVSWDIFFSDKILFKSLLINFMLFVKCFLVLNKFSLFIFKESVLILMSFKSSYILFFKRGASSLRFSNELVLFDNIKSLISFPFPWSELANPDCSCFYFSIDDFTLSMSVSKSILLREFSISFSILSRDDTRTSLCFSSSEAEFKIFSLSFLS